METILSTGTKNYMMTVTPIRLYSFTGIGSLETVFASHLDPTVHFLVLHGEIPSSELHLFIKQMRVVPFGWFSGENIYHGGLYFGAQHSSLNGDANLVKNKALLDYTQLSNGEVSLRHGWNGGETSSSLEKFHVGMLNNHFHWHYCNIKGSIKNMRKKFDHLYFEFVESLESAYYLSWAMESIWQMDFEMIRLYFTKVRLGSPPREFNVQIDTGSDTLWVTCSSCTDCPQSSGLGVKSLPFYFII